MILRLMSYNVRSMRDDRAALGRVIRAAEPDIVLVQEAPRFARWRSLAAQLARSGGLVVVSGGRPAAANLILSTMSVEAVSTRDVLFTSDPRMHQRGTAIALLRKGSYTFGVAGTHLDIEAAPRLRHVGELHAAVASNVPADLPTIVAGDINDVPGSAPWVALAAERHDAFAVAGKGDGFTSSTATPEKMIDGVFVDPRLRVVSARALDSADVRVASDHRPLLVEIEF